MAETWYVSPNTYVTNGYVGSEGVMPSFSYGSTASDGSLRVTVVDGSVYTGMYAADGSINVIPVSGSDYVGLQDGCGAINIVIVAEDWDDGVIHSSGALVVSTSPYYKGTIHITTSTPLTLDAPTLDWDDETNDNLPDFTMSWDALVGDLATIRRSTAVDFSTYEDASDTVDSIDPPNTLEFDFGDVWADGTWYVKSFYTRNAVVSEDSNTETVTLSTADVTDPILSAPAASATGETTMTGTVTSDEGDGTVYVVASTSSSAPSAAQVKAGQMHTGAAAAASDTSPGAVGSVGVSLTGLTAGTAYYLHYMHEDSDGNQSTVVSSAVEYTWIADAYIGTQNTDTGRGGTLDGANNETDWTDINIGAAHPDKKLLVLLSHNSNSTRITDFQASGLTFTKLASYGTADDTNNTNTVAAFIASAPSGGSITAMKAINDSAADPGRVAACFYTTMRSATLHDIEKQNGSAINSLGGTIDLAADGALFAISQTTTASNDITWTGVNEDNDDFSGATTNYSSAHYSHTGAAEAGRTITADWSVDPSNNIRLLVLSFAART